MVGTVTVTEDEAESQAEIDDRADEELAAYLREGRDAADELAKANQPGSARTEPNGNGGTTHYIETGASTEHTEVLAFAPTDIADLTVNDQVVFINNSTNVHTATFGPESDFPVWSAARWNEFFFEIKDPVPGPSPQALSPGIYANTGALFPLGSSFGDVNQFTFSFDEPGTYDYVCLIHADSDMVGRLEVAAPP
jgi:plastocyanin